MTNAINIGPQDMTVACTFGKRRSSTSSKKVQKVKEAAAGVFQTKGDINDDGGAIQGGDRKRKRAGTTLQITTGGAGRVRVREVEKENGGKDRGRGKLNDNGAPEGEPKAPFLSEDGPGW